MRTAQTKVSADKPGQFELVQAMTNGDFWPAGLVGLVYWKDRFRRIEAIGTLGSLFAPGETHHQLPA